MKTILTCFFIFIFLILKAQHSPTLSNNVIVDHNSITTLGEYEKHINEIENNIQKFRKNNQFDSVFTYIFKKASLMMDINDYDKAANIYTQAADFAYDKKLYEQAISGYYAAKEIYILRGQVEKSLLPMQKALKASYLVKDSCQIGYSIVQMITYYKRLAIYDSAFHYLTSAKNYLKYCSMPLFVETYYTQAAGFHQSLGDYEGAIGYYLKYQESIDLKKDTSSAADNYTTIGRCFYNLKNYEKALYYGQKAYDFSKIKGLKIFRTGAANLVSDIYLNQNETIKAKAILLETLPILRGSSNPIYLVTLLRRLLHIDLKLNNITEAKTYLTEIETILPKIKELHFIIGIKSLQIDYFLKTKQNDIAAKILNDLLPLLNRKLEYEDHFRILEAKTAVYEALGKTDSAYATLKFYYHLKDSIAAANQTRLAYALESRYQLNEKNQTIKDLNVEAQLQAQRIKSSKQLQTILIGGLILATILSGFIFYFYQMKRRQADELAQKNDIITKAYTEKDLLLREIHHRVKNNLQVVSSLLRLQSRHVQDNQAQEALLEGRNRVHSMALIHQYLYRDEDVTKISADEYIKKLANTLYKSYNVSDKLIQFKTQIEPLKLDVDTAIPVGLILNELITNVLKHAFPNKQEGILEVSLLRGGNNEMNLTVKDNGIGFNKAHLKNPKESFGWSLVELFTEKLNGQLNISNGQGTTVNLTFKDISVN